MDASDLLLGNLGVHFGCQFLLPLDFEEIILVPFEK